MSAEVIAHALDGKRSGRHWIARCPAHDDRHPSLLISETSDGRALWVCKAGCEQASVTAALRARGLLIRDSAFRAALTPPPTPQDIEAKQTRAQHGLRRVWNASEPLDLAQHIIARRYLQGRGLAATIPDSPTDLRFSPSLDYWSPDDAGKPCCVGAFPAIVAIVRGPDRKPATLHRTYLAPDGSGKAEVPSPRKLCTPWSSNGLRGAAIRLYPPTTRLAIAEGLETALAIRIASGLATWSCISAYGLANVEIPKTVLEVLIAVDYDRAGLDAADAAARRLTRAGVRVRTAIPDKPGQDWADVIAAVSRKEAAA